MQVIKVQDGVFTCIRTTQPLACCGGESTSWQSKRLLVRVKDHVIEVDHLCRAFPLEIFHEGEIHSWCRDCGKMTQYEIKEGTAVNRQIR